MNVRRTSEEFPRARARLLGAALLAASILLSAAGQLGMKAGMQELHAAEAAASATGAGAAGAGPVGAGAAGAGAAGADTTGPGASGSGGSASEAVFGALAPYRSALAWTLGGLAAYGFSLLAWLAVLVRYPLSYAYPWLGLSYVLVFLGATHWPRLMEPATPMRSLGTLLILAGVALASAGGGAAPAKPPPPLPREPADELLENKDL